MAKTGRRKERTMLTWAVAWMVRKRTDLSEGAIGMCVFFSCISDVTILCVAISKVFS